MFMVQSFLITQSYWVIPIAIAILWILKELNARDEQLVDIIRIKYGLCPNVRNRKFWANTNSYEILMNNKDK